MKNKFAWRMLLCSCLLIGGGQGILVSCAGIFIQPVCSANGFNVGPFSTYLSIGAVAMMIGFPLVDKVLKKFPLKPLMLVCVIVNCGMFMLYSTFTQLWMFYIAVIFTGFSCVIPAYMMGPLLVSNWFQEKRGLAMGIMTACTGVFGAVFSIIGGILISSYGYKFAYVALGAAALVIMLPAVFMLVLHPAQKNMQPYGADASQKAEEAQTGELTGIPKAKAIKSFPFIGMFITIFVMVCLGAFSPEVSVLAINNGFDIATGSLFASVFMIGCLAGSFILGMLNDKIGVKNATLIVLVLGILSVVIVVMGKGNAGILMAGMAVMGIAAAAGGVQPALIVGNLFGQKDYAGIYGVMQIALSLGGVLATPLYGFVLDASGSFTPALLAVAVCLAIGIVLTMAAFKDKEKLWSEKCEKEIDDEKVRV